MTDQTTDQARESTTLHDQIRALLPAHTHAQHSGLFGPNTWTWTTPAGTWTVTFGRSDLLSRLALSFRGPGGGWMFDSADQRGVDQLAAVLRALDAIGDTDV